MKLILISTLLTALAQAAPQVPTVGLGSSCGGFVSNGAPVCGQGLICTQPPVQPGQPVIADLPGTCQYPSNGNNNNNNGASYVAGEGQTCNGSIQNGAICGPGLQCEVPRIGANGVCKRVPGNTGVVNPPTNGNTQVYNNNNNNGGIIFNNGGVTCNGQYVAPIAHVQTIATSCGIQPTVCGGIIESIGRLSSSSSYESSCTTIARQYNVEPKVIVQVASQCKPFFRDQKSFYTIYDTISGYGNKYGIATTQVSRPLPYSGIYSVTVSPQVYPMFPKLCGNLGIQPSYGNLLWKNVIGSRSYGSYFPKYCRAANVDAIEGQNATFELVSYISDKKETVTSAENLSTFIRDAATNFDLTPEHVVKLSAGVAEAMNVTGLTNGTAFEAFNLIAAASAAATAEPGASEEAGGLEMKNSGSVVAVASSLVIASIFIVFA
ncbi:hypothetical protein BJ741DRAFT_700255 [Chytriomyces cf. hyalinus JEL632]|nr:hypothetical protein BJ741DRAFT_700255 [Chytriomyces cf. hyalinus JEL632]